MYTPFDTVYILFETFFVYVKMRELFEVAELGVTPVYILWILITKYKILPFSNCNMQMYNFL
jgi:hypothetical protein